MSKHYPVIEYRKEKVTDEFYTKKVHKFRTVREMVEGADYLALEAEEDLKNGKIVDFEIEY